MEVPSGAWLMAASVALAVAATVPANLLTGWMCGWRALARRYPAADIADGAGVRALSSLSRPGGHKKWVKLRAGADRLNFAAFILHQPGHAPFSVPWADVDAVVEKMWFGTRVMLSFANMPGVRMRVSQRAARRVAEASGGRLVLRRAG